MQNKYIKQSTKLLSALELPIKDEIKRGNSDFNHEVFNVMHLTECPRRMMYRVNNCKVESKFENKNILVDFHSKFCKIKWLGIFSNSKGIKVLDKNILAADSEYNIVGKVDAIISCKGYVSALMIESIDESSYNIAIKNGGLRQQIVALMTSMWLTEVKNGVLLCENKNTNDYFLSHVIVSDAIINGVKSKCSKLMENKTLQQLPLRPYKTNDCEECKCCEYNDKCW